MDGTGLVSALVRMAAVTCDDIFSAFEERFSRSGPREETSANSAKPVTTRHRCLACGRAPPQRRGSRRNSEPEAGNPLHVGVRSSLCHDQTGPAHVFEAAS